LPTFSRKLEVALSWACNIPFPPNIVELRLSKKQSSEADCEGAAAESKIQKMRLQMADGHL
jgi:hypothetical protein